MKTILVNIYGRVQGVGFRYFVMKKAVVYHIKGYVKNETDGSVTLMANGSQEQLDDFLTSVEEGNGFSHIDCLSIEEVHEDGFDDFRVVY
ncbi:MULTISPECIES: acylphosphatase [unclassified Fusibacter]|uniref:acylphosphatase n=1 Tax=unclassified Fusibacter TaxID=2624464 RepID=UPI0010107130|nr:MULTISPECIES: acylphosphatase [unclassified Fusibacter]MCK8059561.1 acylphosphatase [Fusibacter sp. A2]NPE21362.1 acylphosphatase [Fusibacter sp. A1]RXV61779.1 acylphosphatase [Fusibacter sp. A1]